jgi:hypothetical protein
MKNLKESFLENAHMFIMVITLGVTCFGFGAGLPRNISNSSYASFGYEPMSVQYAMDTEQHALDVRDMQQRKSNVGGEFGYVLASIQYAVDAEQQVLDLAGYKKSSSTDGNEFAYIQKSIQYAVDTEQQVIEHRDSQQRQLTAGREESEQLTPAS